MKPNVLFAACFLGVGCLQTESLPRPDLSDAADLLPTDLGPRCAAAAGFSGEALLCVDFSSFPDGKLAAPLPAGLKDWDFTNAASCSGWEIQAGKLRVVDFDKFKGDCRFSTPALPLKAADHAKATIALVHHVDLSGSQQKIQMMLGQDDPDNFLITQWTGRQKPQKSSVTLTYSDATANGDLQPLFKIASTVGTGQQFQGWQVESIAVIGQK